MSSKTSQSLWAHRPVTRGRGAGNSAGLTYMSAIVRAGIGRLLLSNSFVR
jgi:hypothetical protein